MAVIYDINGNPLNYAQSISGEVKSLVYDINGNPIVLSGEMFPIRVLQYNVGQWYLGNHDNIPAEFDEYFYELQSGIISRYNADVLLFEEYTAQFSKAGRTTLSMLQENYPYYHEQTNGTTTKVTQRAIYSKYPLTNYKTHSLHAGYYFDSCTITINNVDIYFICTHFHWNNAEYRSAEADSVLADIAGHEYVIIGGDFNTADNFDVTGEGYIGVVKKFVDAGYTVANGGNFGFLKTYGGAQEPTSCLDNIIVSSNISMTNVIVDRTKEHNENISKMDHDPMIADLVVIM